MTNKTNLPPEAIKFIAQYSAYLEDCIYRNKLSDKVTVYFSTEIFEKISGWKIRSIKRTHYYTMDMIDQWAFETDDGKYGYIRNASGLLCLFASEREYETKFGLGNRGPDRVGAFFPVSRAQLSNLSLQDLVKILRWELVEGAEEEWI
jgi:hypothetical protein